MFLDANFQPVPNAPCFFFPFRRRRGGIGRSFDPQALAVDDDERSLAQCSTREVQSIYMGGFHGRMPPFFEPNRRKALCVHHVELAFVTEDNDRP